MLSLLPIPLRKDPPVGFYFMVSFLAAGILPNPIDVRFQSVSGISATMQTQEVQEGGENLSVIRLPTRMTYGNLTLKRGMMIGSPLNVEFNLAMSTLTFQPGSVLVILLNAKDTPVSSWLFKETYPLSWAVSDLDATQSSVVIDTMELSYTRMVSLRI